ncbi:MAG: FtsX-like permease family protein [Theionarchaea archaeon]|nr:FtsX-like permease family protein [Theionarchaea archaeon]
MGDFKIAYRNIRRRAFSASLTIIGIMVGIAFFLYVLYIIIGFGETVAANVTNATVEDAGLEPYHIVQMVVILAVATVGVTSTMFMSVTQRTREIGIMKALGFSSNSVLRIFMIESLLLGALGGLVGAIVGFVLIWIRNFTVLPENLQVAGSTIISSFLWPLLPVGMVLAIILAGLAGFVPSKRGSSMDPEVALYYEW